MVILLFANFIWPCLAVVSAFCLEKGHKKSGPAAGATALAGLAGMNDVTSMLGGFLLEPQPFKQ